MKSLFPLILYMAYLTAIQGQSDVLNFHQLTVREGLSESNNEFLYTDSHRFTWIGSLDGLNLFDGEEVRTFKGNAATGFRGTDIQSQFFEDSKGNVWFTTGEAIIGYNRLSGTFSSDTLDNGIGEILHYAFYLERDRYLWVISDGGLYRYDTHHPEPTERKPLIDDFYAIRAAAVTDETGSVVVVYGAYWMSDGLEIIDFSAGLDAPKRNRWFSRAGEPADFTLQVKNLVTGLDGEICLLTNRGLLFLNAFHPKCEKLEIYPIPEGYESSAGIEHIADELWLTTNSPVLLRFDLNKRRFIDENIRAFNLDEKKMIDDVDRIFLGRDSVLWIGVAGKGVFFANMRNRRSLSVFDGNELPAQAVHALFETADGQKWCVSNDGVGRIFNEDKSPGATLSLPKYFKAVRHNSGEIWAISGRGVGKLERATVDFTWYEPDDPVGLYDITTIGEKYLLLGTNKGVLLFDTDTRRFISLAGSDDFSVHLYLDSRQRLWVADASDHLTVWDISLEKMQLDYLMAFPSMGIMNHIVPDMHRGLVWVATSKGLVRIDSDNFQRATLTEADGLGNQYIRAILIDNYQNLWLSTNKGIIRYCPEAKRDQSFMQLTTRDGLSTDEYSAGAALMASNGELWFGSTAGVDVIDPDWQHIGSAPALALKKLKVHDKSWVGDSSIMVKRSLVFPHQKNTLTFELSALEYTDPMRNKFKVYLIYDNVIDSSYLGTDNTITYANLPPNHYQFRFTAGNAEDIWQQEYYQMDVIINPPFHQTWWFRTLAGLLLLAIGSFSLSFYYRYQLRLKQLELERQKRLAEREQQKLEKKLALQSERDRIAGEMHDELGGGLSTIRNASAKAERKQDPEEVRQVLRRISEISLGLIRNMRELIWAMNPENDSLADLVAQIRRYTAEFMADNGLAVSINIPEQIPEQPMTSQARHNLLLIVKEILHNIVKHAQAEQVVFDLQLSDGFQLTITDDGKGFAADEPEAAGFGIANCKNRVDAIGGDIRWSRPEQGGTQVTVVLALHPSV